MAIDIATSTEGLWGGMHYPSTVDISDAVGEAIAYYVNLNSNAAAPRRARG